MLTNFIFLRHLRNIEGYPSFTARVSNIGSPSSYIPSPSLTHDSAYVASQSFDHRLPMPNAVPTATRFVATMTPSGFFGHNTFATPTVSTGFDRSSFIRQAWRKYMRTLDECEDMMRQARKEFDDVVDEVDRYLG